MAYQKTIWKDRTENEDGSIIDAEKLNKIENQLENNDATLFDMSQEITEARTGYFGKEHASLQDRLNDEFQFVTVDNSRGMYVEQSTNESSIKIENSIEGRARDTVVKGRTLQNLGGTKRVDMSNSHNRTLLFSTSYPLKASDIYFLHFTLDITEPLDGTNALKIFFKNIDGENFNYYSTGIVTSGDYILKLDRFSFNGNVKDIIGVGMYFEDKPINAGMRVSIKDVMVLSTNTEQHYFEGIKSLGEEDNNRISILSHGKNLLDKNKAVELMNGKISNCSHVTDTGFNVKAGTAIETTILKFNNPINECYIKYDISTKFNGDEPKTSRFLRMIYEDGTKTQNYANNGSVVIKSTQGKKVSYIEISFLNSKYEVEFKNLIISTNENDLYEPYKQDKKDILLPVQNGAKGLPQGAEDELYSNGDYLQKCGAKLLNSGNTWILQGTTSKYIECTEPITDIRHPISNVISDKLKLGFIGSAQSDNTLRFSITDIGRVRISPFSKHDMTLQEGLDWIKSNPITFVYELAEPILHKATEPTNNNPATFKDITNVSCLNKIAPSNMLVKVAINIAAEFSRLNKECKILENKNIVLEQEVKTNAIYFNKQNLNLVSVDFETDFRLMELEFALNIPLNNKFINTLLRTPYKMAKTLILAGVYERSNMEHKLYIYLERGRMTQNEYDELITLIDNMESKNI